MLGFTVKDADWPSPLASDLAKKFINMKIKTDTKEPRKRKGIIPIATLFIRLYQFFGHPEG